MHLRKSVQFILAVFLWEKFDSVLLFFFKFSSIKFLLDSLGFSDGELNLNFLPVPSFSWALMRSCITLAFMMFVCLHQASVARQMGVCCLVMCHSASWRSDFSSDRLLEQIVAVSECLFSNCSTGSSRSFWYNQAVLFKLGFPLSSCFSGMNYTVPRCCMSYSPGKSMFWRRWVSVTVTSKKHKISFLIFFPL